MLVSIEAKIGKLMSQLHCSIDVRSSLDLIADLAKLSAGYVTKVVKQIERTEKIFQMNRQLFVF